MIRTRL